MRRPSVSSSVSAPPDAFEWRRALAPKRGSISSSLRAVREVQGPASQAESWAGEGFSWLRRRASRGALAGRRSHRRQHQSERRSWRRAFDSRRRSTFRGYADRHRISVPTKASAALWLKSVFEYGPRVGCWRLLRIFKRFDVKISMLGVVRGMLMYPELTRAFVEEGHEVVSHGWRWLDYCQMSEDEEREHVRLAVKGIKKLTGAPPVGWFSGRSSMNTRRLLVEHGGLLVRPRLFRRRTAFLDKVWRSQSLGGPLFARNQ